MNGGRVYCERFVTIPELVLFADISPNALRLFALFQWHGGQEGRCYPGLKRLAELMNCSIDTVGRARRELVSAGLIECRERHDEHGRRTTDDVYLTAVVRGAPRKSAGYVPRNGAGTNSKAVELNTDELDIPAPPQKRPPTDTSQINPSAYAPFWETEPKATSADRQNAARRLREIRQRYDPDDCLELGCHDDD